MATKLVSAKTERITTALAKKFRDMQPTPPRDRPLGKGRINFLKNEIDANRFRLPVWAAVYCIATECFHRLNGQHTSTIFCEKMPAGQLVHVEYFECDTVDEIAELYSTFDHTNGSRKPSELNQIVAGTRPVLRDVPAATINNSVTGISYAIWNDHFSSQMASKRCAVIQENVKFILWLNNILDGYKGVRNFVKPLRRGGVVAAMYKTWQECPDTATAFWRNIRDESAPSDDPTRDLARWLRGSRCREYIPSSKYTAVGIRELYCRSILAWNAVCLGGIATDVLRYDPRAKIPAVVNPKTKKPRLICERFPVPQKKTKVKMSKLRMAAHKTVRSSGSSRQAGR